jgi:hypothetical protein
MAFPLDGPVFSPSSRRDRVGRGDAGTANCSISSITMSCEQERKTRELEETVEQLRQGVLSAGNLEQWTNEDRAYKYRAFITYSHLDKRWAMEIQRSLEQFRVPKNAPVKLRATGKTPARIGRVFLDREELSASVNLREVIARALSDSAWLIVVCSPSAATSSLVNAEVELFSRTRRGGRIIPVIVGGRPHDPEFESLPPALRADDPLGVDIRAGRKEMITRIAASMLSMPVNELRRGELRRRRRASVIVGFALAAIAAGLAGAWYWYWRIAS